MSSRGVVPGDMMRADDAWNDRLRAIEGLEGDGAGRTIVSPETSDMLHADVWAESDKRVLISLAQSYFGVSDLSTEFFGMVFGALAHAAALGVLTERQRWENVGVSVREAKLEAALRQIKQDAEGRLGSSLTRLQLIEDKAEEALR